MGIAAACPISVAESITATRNRPSLLNVTDCRLGGLGGADKLLIVRKEILAPVYVLPPEAVKDIEKHPALDRTRKLPPNDLELDVKVKLFGLMTGVADCTKPLPQATAVIATETVTALAGAVSSWKRKKLSDVEVPAKYSGISVKLLVHTMLLQQIVVTDSLYASTVLNGIVCEA